MASSHKQTKADRRPKSGRRRDRGAETVAALKRIDANRAYEKEAHAQACPNVVEADLKPPFGPIQT